MEVNALSEIMLQVNNRQDLVEHDRATLLRLLDLLYNRENTSPALDEDIARELDRISGRDPELDQLVERGELLTSAAFLRAVTRAALRLGPAEAKRVILGEFS
jgi:hypothetical protein